MDTRERFLYLATPSEGYTRTDFYIRAKLKSL